MDFYDRYCQLCSRKGLKPHSKSTAELIGISNAAAQRWKQGNRPNAETLEKLAKFFGVSVEYLVTGYEPRAREVVGDDPETEDFLQLLATREDMRMLFRTAKGARKEDIELAVRIIEDLRRRGDE
ncbi:MAG: helix-turn-helix transcriptional regulator [Oscillospiraceae bacterium]|nr:helix-turn-helix transcriptional regulator [Oscillospiraceae bacterium]